MRFIFTCCILNPEREEAYVKAITDSVSKLKHLPIKFYVVENTGRSSSKLDTIEGVQVIYTRNNLKDPFDAVGIKEMFDVYEVAERCGFNDDDIVIKLTGRYTLKSAKFVEEVIQNQTMYDFFVKCFNVCTLEYDDADCVLGLYALRYQYLQDINITKMRWNDSQEKTFFSEACRVVEPERILKFSQLDMYFRGDTSFLL